MACLNCQDGSKPIQHRVHGSNGLDGRHGTLLFCSPACYAAYLRLPAKTKKSLLVGRAAQSQARKDDLPIG